MRRVALLLALWLWGSVQLVAFEVLELASSYIETFDGAEALDGAMTTEIRGPWTVEIAAGVATHCQCYGQFSAAIL